MEDIKEFLRSIGIGKNESEIYAALVKEGPMTILEISKVTKIHRPNVYEAINKLIHQGIVWEAHHSQKKVFCARPPLSLVEYLKQKETELQEIARGIIMKQVPNGENRIMLSKGKFALKEALFSLLELNKEIIVYGIPPYALEAIGPIIQEFHRERIKKKILMRHIYNSDGIERAKQLNRLSYTEARCLPSKYDSATTTNVCGNKVLLFSWNREISVIEIIDNDIANSYRNYFELLWKQAKVV